MRFYIKQGRCHDRSLSGSILINKGKQCSAAFWISRISCMKCMDFASSRCYLNDPKTGNTWRVNTLVSVWFLLHRKGESRIKVGFMMREKEGNGCDN